MESNRLNRAGLVLAVSGLVLFAGMIAALDWMPWMQPPLLHILIIFVGLPLAGLLSLVGLGLKVGWIARAGALWVLGLSLVALAVILGWWFMAGDLLQGAPVEETSGLLQQE